MVCVYDPCLPMYQRRNACAEGEARQILWFNSPNLVQRLQSTPAATGAVTVDLHGLHVAEVRSLLRELFITQAWRPRRGDGGDRGGRKRAPRNVSVVLVTGRGLHSVATGSSGGRHGKASAHGGKALKQSKLVPAVTAFLQAASIPYTLPHAGCVQATVKGRK